MLPLPTVFDLPLPKLSNLPATAFLAASMGYIYGKLTDTPALLCAKIFVIAQLANSILFFLAKALFDVDDRSKERLVLAVTTVITQVVGIIAMRHFDLIGKNGTIAWSLFTLGMGLRQFVQAMDHHRTKFLSFGLTDSE